MIPHKFCPLDRQTFVEGWTCKRNGKKYNSTPEYDIFPLLLIYIFIHFNSNIEICIVLQTIHDIGVYFIIHVYKKIFFSLSLHPQLTVISNERSFLFLQMIIVSTARCFVFFCQDTISTLSLSLSLSLSYLSLLIYKFITCHYTEKTLLH